MSINPRSPANRLGVDYRHPPARRVGLPIIDAHAHLRGDARVYFDVARLYGIAKTVSMSPLAEVDRLAAEFPGRIEFIAIPDWKQQARTEDFQRQWMADLEAFRGKGARICKFWMAPPMRQRHGLTLDHPFVRRVWGHAHELGYHFMVHVGDPTLWWANRYSDTAAFGSKADQYPQLENILRDFPDRTVIAAHMAGCIEELDFLEHLLDTYPNLAIDTSATKWISREVARQPEAVRAFMIRKADRILFGSDLVLEAKHDFDHYASRYWVHQMMWETAYRGENPIEDPDAPNPPLLAGVDLPEDVLVRIYRDNYVRLLR